MVDKESRTGVVWCLCCGFHFLSSLFLFYIYIYGTTKNKESAFKLKMLVEGTQVMHYRYWGP